MEREHLELIGIIVGIIGVALGPGGVFYFLVKRGLNGSLDAVNRMDKAMSKISALQNMDHDTLISQSAALKALKEEQDHYHRLVDDSVRSIIAIQSRCELLHQEWATTIKRKKEE